MNIKDFKEGEVITRNEPMVYKHNGSADSSYCGAKLVFVGVDEDSKIIFLHDGISVEPFALSYARDPWNEGWTVYPEKLLAKFFGNKKEKSPTKGVL